MNRMDQAEKKRKLLLGGALLATLLAVVLVDDEEDGFDPTPSVQPTRFPVKKARNPQETVEYLDVEQLGRRKFSAQAGNIFDSVTWTSAVQSRATSQQRINPFAQAKAERPRAPPPAPTPPPLQFKYIGKVIEGSEIRVFLSESNQYHVVKSGDRIDDRYRIDAVDDEAITVTYLPLNAQQKLTINNKVAGTFDEK